MTKRMKRNPMWKGDRLFPPARKSSKPSKAWQFGGFKKNQAGQLVLDQTICSLCGKVLKYRNKPTNLQQHVLAEHPDQWKGGDDDKQLKETKMENFYLPQPNKSVKKYRQDNPKQKKFTKIMAEWIIKKKKAYQDC